MREHQIKWILQRIRPFIGKKADALWLRYKTAEEKEKLEWEQTINLLAQKYGVDSVEEKIVLPPPDKDLIHGDIPIGRAKYLSSAGSEFGLNLVELTRHTGIFGSTGSGKTTLAKNILRKLIEQNIPFIVFDWEKNYRGMIEEFPELKVFTIGHKASPFYFNYLEVPPGLKYQEYIKNVVDVFNRAYIGGVGSDSVLLKVLDTAYAQDRIPTTKDLHEIMSQGMKGDLKGREMLWKQSSMRMFDFLCYGGTGDVLDTKYNYPKENLFEDFIVFELGNLASPYDKKFFVEIFTLWYWLYKEHAGIEQDKLNHVLLFEEFHNILQQSGKDDFIQKIFRQIRKFGTGLVVMDQTPSLIPNAIFENLYTKISFALSHQKNIQAVADSMFMDKTQREFFGLLSTGQAICRLAGRYTKPFLIETPFHPSRENISDEALAKHMERFSQFSRTSEPSKEKTSSVRSFQKTESLSPMGKILLEDIGKKPFVGISKRYKSLGLGVARGTEIQKELLQKGYATALTLEGQKFLVLTGAGKKKVKSFGINPDYNAGKGGFEHAYFVNRLKNHLVDTKSVSSSKSARSKSALLSVMSK